MNDLYSFIRQQMELLQSENINDRTVQTVIRNMHEVLIDYNLQLKDDE